MILNIVQKNCSFGKCIQNSIRSFSSKSIVSGNFRSVVGLEVHARITSVSKLFSGAANDYTAPSNTCVSFFDASIPGTLPRLNKKCVESAVQTAMALSCDINNISMFDRKHYFYADSPAGYQITQQRLPLAVNGEISFYVTNVQHPYLKTSKIHQIQLEQDSGKSLHFPETRTSLLDLNRAGAPLMEIVFEPDLSTGEEAASLLKELSLILTRLGTCSCEMQHGAMRCDANISIHKKGEPFGTRTEVKNIASIRGVANAIEYEISRQIRLVESGGIVSNETRSWDTETGKTIVMRDKEVQQDYRFMPEPNLPPLNLNTIDLVDLRNTLPKMPNDIRATLTKYNFPVGITETLVKTPELLYLFAYVTERDADKDTAKAAAHLLALNLLGSCNRVKIKIEECALSAENFSEIVRMYRNRTINTALTTKLLDEAITNPLLSPIEIVEKNNWKQIHDPEEVKKFCEIVMTQNPKLVRRYRNGIEKELPKLKALTVKLSNYRSNAMVTEEVLKKLLQSD